MKVIKNDWLTIPDAPNYEINSQLLCRNKKTKRLLSTFTGKNKNKYYSLHTKGRNYCVKRSPKTFRSQAVAASNEDSLSHISFAPIPSLGGKYEINNYGTVRNANTKQILTPKHNGKVYHFHIDGKYISRATADLLWEAHGIIIDRRFRPCPCSAENSAGKFFFKSLKACARFLAPKLFFTVGWIHHILTRRVVVIVDWKISYLDRDFFHNDFALAKVNRRVAP